MGTEDFEGFTPGTTAPLSLTFTGAGGATLLGGGDIASVTPGTTNGVRRYATSGSNFWETGSTGFSIDFADPIAAFGFNGIDIGDFNGQVTVTTVGGVNQFYNVGNAISGPGGSVLFWGVIDTDDLFSSITFSNTNAGTDFFGFDDMTIGSLEQVRPAPAPGPLALIALGWGLMGLRRVFGKNQAV